MSSISVGSLFAGIGGLELGLERAGMEVRWQVENDDYASRVLAKHWPDVARYSDVRDVGKHNLEPVDLICGGFPCQDVSLAGQRAGLEGQRSTLWSEFARIICELRPRWVLAENVPGVLSSDSNRFFGAILRDLAAAGYAAEWQSIPAAAVGAPHLRWRVFIVAHSNGCEQGRGIKSERVTTGRDSDTAGNGEERDMANANREWQLQPQGVFSHERRRISDGGWWATEPAVRRVADELSEGVDGFDGIEKPHHNMGITSGGISDAHAQEGRPNKELCVLRQGVGEEEDRGAPRGPHGLSEEKVLRPNMYGSGISSTGCDTRSVTETGRGISGRSVRDVREPRVFVCTPQGRESRQQSEREPDDIVRFLSHEMALDTWQASLEEAGYLQDLRFACEEIGHVSEALSALPQVWQSLSDEERTWIGLYLATGSPWCTEWPGVPRVATDIPARVDRLRTLGNAVVPAVAEYVGRMIVDADSGRTEY